MQSPLSVVILDNIERLLEYVPIGPRFSNTLLQIILELLEKAPPRGRRLLIIGTSGDASVMQQLGVAAAFNMAFHVPRLQEEEIRQVMLQTKSFPVTEVLPPASYSQELPAAYMFKVIDTQRVACHLNSCTRKTQTSAVFLDGNKGNSLLAESCIGVAGGHGSSQLAGTGNGYQAASLTAGFGTGGGPCRGVHPHFPMAASSARFCHLEC